jgi:hypothetical protein
MLTGVDQANARRQVTIALHVIIVASIVWGGNARLLNSDIVRLALRHDYCGSLILKVSS